MCISAAGWCISDEFMLGRWNGQFGVEPIYDPQVKASPMLGRSFLKLVLKSTSMFGVFSTRCSMALLARNSSLRMSMYTLVRSFAR